MVEVICIFYVIFFLMIEDGNLAGLTARAVIIVDENGKVIYAQLVPEITEEPDYDAALSALK